MQTTAADLRAEIARKRVQRYELAVRVGMHPARLGAFLNERLPLRRDVADRISEALSAMPGRREAR